MERSQQRASGRRLDPRGFDIRSEAEASADEVRSHEAAGSSSKEKRHLELLPGRLLANGESPTRRHRHRLCGRRCIGTSRTSASRGSLLRFVRFDSRVERVVVPAPVVAPSFWARGYCSLSICGGCVCLWAAVGCLSRGMRLLDRGGFVVAVEGA